MKEGGCHGLELSIPMWRMNQLLKNAELYFYEIQDYYHYKTVFENQVDVIEGNRSHLKKKTKNEKKQNFIKSKY